VAAQKSLARSLTLTADVVRAIVADAVERGVPIDELRATFDIPAAALADVDARVPAELLIRLWDGVPRLGDDDCFGIRLGERSAAKSLPLAARIFESSDTVGEGVERLIALQRVLNDVHHTELVRTADFAAFRVQTKGSPLPVPPHAIDFVFAWMVVSSRRATGRDFAPSRVVFEHARPRDASEHRRILGCPVEFDADYNELAFHRSVLDLPLATRDPALLEILESHARILLARLPEKPTFAGRVRDALVPLLAKGATIDAVAASLRMSTRSVQRYLRDEGTSFADALDQVRRRHAEVALRDGARSIAEISRALGFADQSAFHRAFVRWTGTTPGAYRRASR
jgi:AraC-like DNA-binding protein